MKTLLYRFFIKNWPRKLISLILAMIIWMLVNHSMSASKSVSNVSIRVTNLPIDRTIEGMQADGTMLKKVSLNLVGQKSIIENLSGKDLEIQIDALEQTEEWVETIGKKNIVSLCSQLDPVRHISKMEPFDLLIKPSKLVTERIPITVTQPIGEVPKGYQFLDIYPYQLFLTITGPEQTVKDLKSQGLKLTFNLSDISRSELDSIYNSQAEKTEEIVFSVPDEWKKLPLPQLSNAPALIDDPKAKELKIGFSRKNLLPIHFPIPVTVFFPPQYSKLINPETHSVKVDQFIRKKNGIKLIDIPLYAGGVNRLFLETVKDMMQISVIAAPKQERENLLWNVEFLLSQELENRFVSKALSEAGEIVHRVPAHLLDDYLRNRFRTYMSRFRLYTPDNKKLSLRIEMEKNSISIAPQNYP